eukprot:GFUD01067010.1.p1 GENE.GFUD01067010.1~~GFUD01067010.1.p1  ORF type:complete len:119 (-),score=8.47 GFUD01067010.1:49-405(-)
MLIENDSKLGTSHKQAGYLWGDHASEVWKPSASSAQTKIFQNFQNFQKFPKISKINKISKISKNFKNFKSFCHNKQHFQTNIFSMGDFSYFLAIPQVLRGVVIFLVLLGLSGHYIQKI